MKAPEDDMDTDMVEEQLEIEKMKYKDLEKSIDTLVMKNQKAV